MASLEELYEERRQKLEKVKMAGLIPFPKNARLTNNLAEITVGFASFLNRRGDLRVGGRIMALRRQGAVTFFDLNDGTDHLQGLLRKDDIDEKMRQLFTEAVDVGDFIVIEGDLFLTKSQEKTILVKKWEMLAKGLRPLPEKWHGLQDIEERFRRRYLDSLCSEEVKQRFILRSQLIREIRSWLDSRGFLEVETPVLQPLAGGASALPFVTHHEALNTDFYLRISEELYLKRFLIGGFPRVYSIAKNFRNEGIDVMHNPEFTMLEFYEAYSSASQEQSFVEQMIREISKKLLGKNKIAYNGKEIDLSNEFNRITYFNLLSKYVGDSVDWLKSSREELKVLAEKSGIQVEKGTSREKIMDIIYKKLCRPNLIQPTFIIDYPVNYLPLAKRKPDNPELVDAFQLVIGGLEIAKAFAELNDPIDQRSRFEAQEKDRKEGDKEAQRFDEDFLEALEYGMPPAGGVGIGIDRLTMLLTDTQNIKEVIFFPTLKPK